MAMAMRAMATRLAWPSMTRSAHATVSDRRTAAAQSCTLVGPQMSNLLHSHLA